ncbi:MAG: FecR domain-containing protein, partial [Ruminiclostridium sp.]
MSLKSAISALSTKAKILIGAAAIVVVGAAVAAVILLSGGTDTYRVLKVFELDGSAVISREGTGELSAYVGMNLESGDTLTVGEGSTMRISMDNDKYVLLDGGTVLELTAEGSPADSRTSIKLVKGTILNELTSSLSANSSYEVSTPKSTMAVRGTSFLVSVIENEDGSYTITVQTFHGKVEVTLLDSEGRPTDKKVLVTEDNCVIIRTVVNKKTGNPAEIDGISFFAFEAGSNIYVEVPNGENPVFGIDYSKLLDLIKKQLLKSNDSGLLVLSKLVEGKLRGSAPADNPETQTAASSAATTAQLTTTAAPESDTTTLLPPPEASTSPVTAPPTTAATATTTAATSTATTTGTKAAITTKETKASTTKETKPAATKKETKATTAETKAVTTTAETTTTTTTPPTTTTARIPDITAPPIITTTTPPTETTTTTTTPATPEPETFMVYFIGDGVTVYSEEVESGSTVSYVPEVPAKTGYTGEWVVGEVAFTADTVITGETNVTAKYTAISYNVVFLNEDGGVVGRTTADYDTKVPASAIPAVPGKTGYTGEWTFDGAAFTADTVIKGDTNVTAKYTINTYTVTFKAEGSAD